VSGKKTDYTKIPSTKKMAGNTIWNIIGSGLPLFFGLLAFPIMINEQFGFGKERLEIIGIVWMLVGFSSIFDMGLGRALTKLFTEKLCLKKHDELNPLFWTAIIIICSIGIVIGVVIIAVLPNLATRGLPPVLKSQAVRSFVVIGCAIPLIVLNVGLQGVLQACQKFKLLNLIRIIFGSYTFLSPLLVLLFTKNIYTVVIVLIVGRIVEMMAYFLGCISSIPELRKGVELCPKELKPLFGFGGWMTVSNISVSLMTHINRFIIRTLEKIGNGTYYFIPEELVVRMLIIPKAWIDVLFPALVTSFANRDNDNTELFSKGVKYMILVMFPIVLGVTVLSFSLFCIWLPDGRVFAEKSAFIMITLALGVYVHSIARFVWYFIQAAGRPDLAARLHIIEFPVYVVVAYLLVRKYGINGAAAAWTLRTVADMILLSIMSAKFISNAKVLFREISMLLIFSIILILLAVYPSYLPIRIGIAAIGVPAFYVFSWIFMLSDAEHKDLLSIYNHLIERFGLKQNG